ncbi:multicopper oxidase domain-containing protein [Rhodoferax ferrireducens]|uniref:multicopper oxidase domain-containing protein n=1 Tax=Rhodoferax ferrireducens TaxID=192843 RepID=UPI000E0CFFB8|nr:multicopper oxidase domain-containing protein [Rhodoferax ferrireducens]
MDIKSNLAAPLAKLLLGMGLVLAVGQASAAEYWLCAKAGSVTINGQSVPIWGYVQDNDANLANGCVGTPTLPGPALTVGSVDTGLTVHLRNELPEPTSIVIPGQVTAMSPVWTDGTSGPRTSVTQRVRSFTHEAATGGGTGNYVWSSVKPGTYLYHSGTHPQVQVQMGLYGALTKNSLDAVVDVNPAEAYSGVPYDTAVTLLFSEIDPAQHSAIAAGTFGTASAPGTPCLDSDGTAMPLTSTLCYRPKYFLLNGKPFQPGDSVLATLAPGQNTLLRLLNAGYRAYAPLIQGTHMKMIAEDGNRYQYRVGATSSPRDQFQYSTWLAALKTTDAIIAPTTPGKYPIYDRRLNTVTANSQDGGLFGILQVASGTGSDLAITKTDGVNSVAQSATMTYTIVVSNAGPDAVTGATVTDTMPAALSAMTWTCTGAACGGPSGSGSINQTLGNLGAGANVTYVVTATVSAGATGHVVNTATVAAATDTNLANNSATDSDTIQAPANADLGITINNGASPVVAGSPVQYTLVVSNAGPAAATGATVSNTMPTQVTAYSWACAATPGSSCPVSGGNGSINVPVNLQAGGSATFAVNATVSASATGNLVNTATVTAPAGVTDLASGNNSATDTDAIGTPQANLGITKTDGLTSVNAGGLLTYTIVVSNAGPSSVTGALVSDTMPVALTGVTWTCSAAPGSLCPAPTGSGTIANAPITLPNGGSVTFLVRATVSPAATGTLSNTATVTAPAGVTDLVPANNSATDTTTLQAASADLSITNSDGVTNAGIAGASTVRYTIVVHNAGPSVATGATVSDANSGLTNVTWNCVATAGSACTLPIGTNSINTAVNLAVGGSATFVVNGTVSPFVIGTLVNTATVTAPALVTDPNTTNNIAIDTDAVTSQANLAITKTDGQTQVVSGLPLVYTIVVSNAGPSAATNATVTDTFPAAFTGASWTCVATPGSTCPANGSGSMAATPVTLAPGGSATFAVSGTVAAAATGNLVNTATVAVPAGAIDPASGNNSATDTDTIIPALPVLTLRDNFNRTNANNLGAGWSQAGTGGAVDLRVNNNQVLVNATNDGGQAIWNATSFGATQMAAFTFANGTINNSALILKATGGTTTSPQSFVRVLYQTANGGQVVVQTTANGGTTFTTRGTLDNANSGFANANTLTARVLDTGVVQVWKTAGANAVFVGSVTLPSTAPWTSGGGWIGMKFQTANTRIDNFSGN